ncbi:MAG: hypothetical protein K8U57_37175 [Planctomycetes bacterium]|nr:hypothetical protein [Planctomycetota bacterium]
MTVTLNLLAPSAAASAAFEARSGTRYVSDAYGVINAVALGDIVDLINSGCVPLGQAGVRNNYAGTTAPTTSNDSTQDYGIGSRWLDTTNKLEYICVDATATAAVWITALTSTKATQGPVLKQGANGLCGTFTLNGATPVTVSNTNVAITDAIIISLNTVGGTVGVQPHIATITAATGFTVVGTASDTSVYNYAILKNAA